MLRKLNISFGFVGIGLLVIASILLLSTWIPLLSIVCHKNLIDFMKNLPFFIYAWYIVFIVWMWDIDLFLQLFIPNSWIISKGLNLIFLFFFISSKFFQRISFSYELISFINKSININSKSFFYYLVNHFHIIIKFNDVI